MLKQRKVEFLLGHSKGKRKAVNFIKSYQQIEDVPAEQLLNFKKLTLKHNIR